MANEFTVHKVVAACVIHLVVAVRVMARIWPGLARLTNLVTLVSRSK